MSTDLKEFSGISFTSDIANLPQAEVLVENVCKEYNIHPDNYGNVLIAVTEAVNNAIKHGNGLDITKSVNIKVLTNDGFLEFHISDEGHGFDFNNLPDPTAPENLEKENGRGIFLMNALSDEVEFLNNGSCVALKFQL